MIAGGSAAAVEYTVFIGLHFFIGDRFLIISQSISFLCGFAVSFILNKKWVFKSDGDSKKELTKYAILALINLTLSDLLMLLFVHKVHIVFWLAKFIIMALVAAWNYIIYQKIVFAKEV